MGCVCEAQTGPSRSTEQLWSPSSRGSAFSVRRLAGEGMKENGKDSEILK